MNEYLNYLKEVFAEKAQDFVKGLIFQAKVFVFGIIALFILGIALIVFLSVYWHNSSQTSVSDVKDMTYVVGTETFTLKNGVAEKDYTPSSASKNVLRIFGEPVYGDLNGDGKATDAAVLLQNDAGGSGMFYYAVLVMNNNGLYQPTNTMFLGDRIAPQTVEIQEGRALYNFAVRRADEPFTMPPSIGKSIWVHYDAKTNDIGEWVKDFEGESR